MANTSNVCMFEGRIAKDPQFTQVNSQNGPLEKATFDIAVDRGMSAAQRQAAQSNNQQTADFIHCSMIGNKVNTLKQYFPKGKAIKVVCHYTQYTYQNKQTGQTEYGHHFDVDDIGFVIQDAKGLSQDNSNAGVNNGFAPIQQNLNGNMYGSQPQQQYGNPYAPQQNNNFMGAPQAQNNGNFEMYDASNSASPF